MHLPVIEHGEQTAAYARQSPRAACLPPAAATVRARLTRFYPAWYKPLPLLTTTEYTEVNMACANFPTRVLPATLAVTLLVLLTLPLSGCNTVQHHLRGESLERAVKGYERAMRWSNFPIVLSLHKFPEDQPLPLPEDYEAYQITGYDTVYAMVQTGTASAHQTIKIEYVEIDTQRVKSVHDAQAWEYDSEGGRWVVTSPFALPARKARR